MFYIINLRNNYISFLVCDQEVTLQQNAKFKLGQQKKKELLEENTDKKTDNNNEVKIKDENDNNKEQIEKNKEQKSNKMTKYYIGGGSVTLITAIVGVVVFVKYFTKKKKSNNSNKNNANNVGNSHKKPYEKDDKGDSQEDKEHNPNKYDDKSFRREGQSYYKDIPKEIENDFIDISNCSNIQEIFNKYKKKYQSISDDELNENVEKYQVYHNQDIKYMCTKFEDLYKKLFDISYQISYLIEAYNQINKIHKVDNIIDKNNIFILELKYKLNNTIKIYNELITLAEELESNSTIDSQIENRILTIFINKLCILSTLLHNTTILNYTYENNIAILISKIIFSNFLFKEHLQIYNIFCIILLINAQIKIPEDKIESLKDKLFINNIIDKQFKNRDFIQIYYIYQLYIMFFAIFQPILAKIYTYINDIIDPCEICDNEPQNKQDERFNKAKNSILNIDSYLTSSYKECQELFTYFIYQITIENEINKTSVYNLLKIASIDNLQKYSQQTITTHKEIFDQISKATQDKNIQPYANTP